MPYGYMPGAGILPQDDLSPSPLPTADQPIDTGAGGGDSGFSYQPPSMYGPQDPAIVNQGQGKYPSLEGLDSQQKTLYGEYLAQHGDQAAVKLEELSKAAKFRRALAMLTETFATITGRQDIAAFARHQVAKEDTERAHAIEGQILARVGQRALEREREVDTLKADIANQRLQGQQQAREMATEAKSLRMATQMHRYFQPGPDGQTPSIPEVQAALKAQMYGDPSLLQELTSQYAFDELAYKEAASAATTIGANTGAAGAAKIAVGGAIAGAGAAAAEAARSTPQAIEGAAKRAGAIAGAQAQARLPAQQELAQFKAKLTTKGSSNVGGKLVANAAHFADMTKREQRATRDSLANIHADMKANPKNYKQEDINLVEESGNLLNKLIGD